MYRYCYAYLNKHTTRLYVSVYLLNYSRQHSPSWEANSFSPGQEIPHILWNPKVRYRIHKCPQAIPILSQLYPVHSSHPISWRSIFILSSHLRLDLPSGLIWQRLAGQECKDSLHTTWRHIRGVILQVQSLLPWEIEAYELSNSKPDRFNPGSMAGTHWIAGWNGPRASQDFWRREKPWYSCWHSKPKPYKAARRHVTPAGTRSHNPQRQVIPCLPGDKNSNSKSVLNIFELILTTWQLMYSSLCRITAIGSGDTNRRLKAEEQSLS